MTTEEKKKVLKAEVSQKYERIKYKFAVSFHKGEISKDDLRMRNKFIDREKAIKLAEIDHMSYYKINNRYESLMQKSNPDE